MAGFDADERPARASKRGRVLSLIGTTRAANTRPNAPAARIRPLCPRLLCLRTRSASCAPGLAPHELRIEKDPSCRHHRITRRVLLLRPTRDPSRRKRRRTPLLPPGRSAKRRVEHSGPATRATPNTTTALIGGAMLIPVRIEARALVVRVLLLVLLSRAPARARPADAPMHAFVVCPPPEEERATPRRALATAADEHSGRNALV